MLSVPLDYVEYLFKMLKIHAKNCPMTSMSFFLMSQSLVQRRRSKLIEKLSWCLFVFVMRFIEYYANFMLQYIEVHGINWFKSYWMKTSLKNCSFLKLDWTISGECIPFVSAITKGWPNLLIWMEHFQKLKEFKCSFTVLDNEVIT